MLTEGKGLSTNKLGTLLVLHLAHTHFASVLMLLGLHLDVVLREAAVSMVLVEGAIATVENIGFGVGQVWIAFSIDSAILVSDVFGHQGSTVCRIFTVENQQCLGRLFMLEQLCGELVLVIEVDRTVYMATFVFILESTVDDDPLVI